MEARTGEGRLGEPTAAKIRNGGFLQYRGVTPAGSQPGSRATSTAGSAARRRDEFAARPGSLARSRGTRGRAQWCRPPRRDPITAPSGSSATGSRMAWIRFAATVQPLFVQYRIDLRRQRRRLPSLRLAPGGTKCLSIGAAAEEARSVTGGKRHSFIEKEKLGPAAPGHQLPAAYLVVEDTDEPRLGRPAPAKQRFGCGVVDDPAVADVKPSLRDRDDIAKRGHPVLQRSPITAHSSRQGCGAHRLPVCPHILRDKRLAAGAGPAPIRHSLPRPSPAAPSEPSTIQRRHQSSSHGGGPRSGMWPMESGTRRRQSRPSSATGIPALYAGMCALEDLAGGARGS